MPIPLTTSFELELPSGFTVADIESVHVHQAEDRDGWTVSVILRGDHPIYARKGRPVFNSDELTMADDVVLAVRAEVARADRSLGALASRYP